MDFLEGRRRDEEIASRARWSAAASTKRYKQSALALREASKWPVEVMRWGKIVEGAFPGFLTGKNQLPDIPW